jgi:hypothetical protein
MTFAALYAILVGIAIIGYWVFFLVKKLVPELETEPIRILFHVAAELVTAIVLLAGGWGLLTKSSWGAQVYLVSMGMLLYTVIESPGYFAQKRVWLMVGVFAVVLVLSLISLGLVL